MIHKKIESGFAEILQGFLATPAVEKMVQSTLTREEYRAMLREVFHHTRENPQLQAEATVRFRGKERDVVRDFLKHAGSEVGHDQLALNDYVTLGGDADHVPYETPLPATSALIAFGFYTVRNFAPPAYLGYLYFLEFTPTSKGPAFMDGLASAGVPREAMTFLLDHTTIDVGHNRLMERYLASIVETDGDIDTLLWAAQTTAVLYDGMLTAAMKSAQSGGKRWLNWAEIDADRAGYDAVSNRELKVVGDVSSDSR